MLFTSKYLDLIKKGKVVTAFRKWKRPTVKENGTLLTPVGQLKIISIDKISYHQISEKEILQAGYHDREEMDKELNMKHDGDIYKIQFVLAGEDPRILLRQKTEITDSEFKELLEKLDRLDSLGKVQNWTNKILEAVDANPGLYAIEYANQLGFEKKWFKVNIRKLKNLGLTISLSDGYKISPRGKELLKKLKQRPKR